MQGPTYKLEALCTSGSLCGGCQDHLLYIRLVLLFLVENKDRKGRERGECVTTQAILTKSYILA